MKFEEQIFLGNGDHSLAGVGHLYSILGRALVILGGIQQPPRSCDPKESTDRWIEKVGDGEEMVFQIADEIHVALTGHKVVKTEDVGNRFSS